MRNSYMGERYECKHDFQDRGGGHPGHDPRTGIEAQRTRRTCIFDQPGRASTGIVVGSALYLRAVRDDADTV